MKISREEKIRRFGYDPNGGLEFLGVTRNDYPYLHSDGNTYRDKFEFYYNPASGEINVNHFGCNGTLFSGREKDGVVTFRVPFGYPAEELFVAEFVALRDSSPKNPQS